MAEPPSTRCEECETQLTTEEWRARSWVCPTCAFPNPMPALARLHLISDPGSLGPLLRPEGTSDPLGFVDLRPYPARLVQAQQQTGLDDAFIAATATIGGLPALVGAFDFAFMGGTMSAAVGDCVARVFEQASREQRAVVICTASGGARMQEGTLALFQMTRTVAALARFRAARKPFIAVLGHPTLGGVGASFATRADVLIGEPRARIGFAGPRVIEQLIGRALPAGFQRAEFLREHGFLDRVVPREALYAELARLLPMLTGGAV